MVRGAGPRDHDRLGFHLLTSAMCGRFALGIDHEDIFNQLRQDGLIPEDDDQEWIDREHFHPRYNIAPRSRAPVIRRRRRKDSNEEDLSVQQGGTNIGNMHAEPKKEAAVSAQLQSKTSVQTMVQTMRWGLVPAYANDDHPSQTANTINTRVETILQGPSMWLRLLGSKRCVILCDGCVILLLAINFMPKWPFVRYYEWLAKTSKLRVPHFIRNSDKSKKIYMAGLWDEVMFEGERLLSTGRCIWLNPFLNQDNRLYSPLASLQFQQNLTWLGCMTVCPSSFPQTRRTIWIVLNYG